MRVNFAVMFGYNVGGIICGIAAALGIVLPSIIIFTIVTFFYDLIRTNIYIYPLIRLDSVVSADFQ